MCVCFTHVLWTWQGWQEEHTCSENGFRSAQEAKKLFPFQDSFFIKASLKPLNIKRNFHSRDFNARKILPFFYLAWKCAFCGGEKKRSLPQICSGFFHFFACVSWYQCVKASQLYPDRSSDWWKRISVVWLSWAAIDQGNLKAHHQEASTQMCNWAWHHERIKALEIDS